MRTSSFLPLVALTASLALTISDDAGATNVSPCRPVITAVGRNHAAGDPTGPLVNDHRTHNAELVIVVPVKVSHLDARVEAVVIHCRGQGPGFDERRPI